SRPLGMSATVWRRQDVPAARLALGYGRRISKASPDAASALREEPQLGDGAYAAMGGLYTSMRDLARYAAFQLDAWPPRDDPDRAIRPAADLETAQQEVASFLDRWDAALAQARFDRTFWFYESEGELEALLLDLRARLGQCRTRSLEPENALRGTEKLQCERG